MKDTITETAKKHGWHFLMKTETDVQVLLNDNEKIELGNQMQKALMEARDLEDQKKSYDDAIKAEIKGREDDAYSSAKVLSKGYKIIEKPVHCYADVENGKRIYFDHETGEIVKEEELHAGDRQMVMDAEAGDADNGSKNNLYDKAVSIVAGAKQVSVSMLQRKLKVGFNQVTQLIQSMEEQGVVSELDENGSRSVLVH